MTLHTNRIGQADNTTAPATDADVAEYKRMADAARLRDLQLDNRAYATRIENDALRLAKASERIRALESGLGAAADYLAMLVDDHREIRFARGEEAKARAGLKGKE